MNPSNRVRISIIGAGIIAQSIHIPSILRAGFELISVCDLSRARADEVARRYGVESSTNPAEVFADDRVDAVLIATPGSHAQLTIAALNAGKHVLAEKPLALNVSELDAIDVAHRKAGTVLQVGYMKMYDPLSDRARKEISELENVRLVRVTVSHPADAPQIEHLRMKPPVDDADQDAIAAAIAYEREQTEIAIPGAAPEFAAYFRNVIHGSLIHETSLLRGLGFTLPTTWAVDVFPQLSGSTPSSLLAVGAQGDTRFVLSWNWLPDYPEYDEELKVLGSNGRVEYRLAKPYVLEERSRLIVQRHVGTERRDTTFTEINETGFLRQLIAFAEAITTGSPVHADLAGTREDVAVLNAIATAAMNRSA